MKSDETMSSVRYSETYREVGHDFIYTPEVLYLDYWLKYKILSWIDVATYVTLQLFCENSISFTIEDLARKSKCSIATLQQRFDDLENAELLKPLRTDQQGEPIYFILLTPKSSLEKDAVRLKHQVEENHAKQLREFPGNQNKSLFQKVKSSIEMSLAK
jgi:AraC-like DNA-binding protein